MARKYSWLDLADELLTWHLVSDLHVRAGLQAVLIARHDLLSFRDAVLHVHHGTALLAHLQRPHFDGLVRLDDIREHPVRTPLHGSRGNGQRTLVSSHENPCINVLTRPELVPRVGKDGLEPDGAGRLVDLIVDEGDRAPIQLLAAIA